MELTTMLEAAGVEGAESVENTAAAFVCVATGVGGWKAAGGALPLDAPNTFAA
jgi:hypothetical protein